MRPGRTGLSGARLEQARKNAVESGLETVKRAVGIVQLLLVPWALLGGGCSAIQRPLALVCKVFAQHVYEWRIELRVSQRELGRRAKSEVQLRPIQDSGPQVIDDVIKKC
jgi:hypothetical protein